MLLEGVISSTIEACNTEDETEFCCFKSKEEGMMSEEGPPSPFNNSIHCTRQERVDARHVSPSKYPCASSNPPSQLRSCMHA